MTRGHAQIIVSVARCSAPNLADAAEVGAAGAAEAVAPSEAAAAAAVRNPSGSRLNS